LFSVWAGGEGVPNPYNPYSLEPNRVEVNPEDDMSSAPQVRAVNFGANLGSSNPMDAFELVPGLHIPVAVVALGKIAQALGCRLGREVALSRIEQFVAHHELPHRGRAQQRRIVVGV
jgi:hypothetical protein